MVTNTVVVIGGGIAGIEVANQLSVIGYDVILLEKSERIGGKLLQWDRLFPTYREAMEVVLHQMDQIHPHKVNIITNAHITGITGKAGNFSVHLQNHPVIKCNAVVLTTGFELFNPRRKEEYGYGIYNNVITSAELESRFKTGVASQNPLGVVPKRVAFIHCVGSRDEKVGNHFCSKVCCITGVKQATELQHLIPNAEIYCFYMDLRMYGEGFEELYRKAQEKNNIQFIRGRVSEVSENMDHTLQLKAEDTLSGRPLKMNVDLLVLLVGMEAVKDTASLYKNAITATEPSGFLKPVDVHLKRNNTTVEGIFMAGTCICPMSVNDTLDNARSAVFAVHQYFQKKFSNEKVRVFTN